nr:putative ribonuclease H-like domain-containing protein [Tanacetum cinerariifolium]
MDLEFPDKVYKVEKALYGLHQAPRAWYETLSTYLLDNRFKRATIDKTLFIKKIKHDILLVQVYVDDIIFGSTKRSLSTEFKQLMHKRFQMSSMGELIFFLGLQTKIYIDNESAICVVKNLAYHSKTKHIDIRHHFIRDSYEKRLIEMVKIHTNYNVADLLTKAFDVTRIKAFPSWISSTQQMVINSSCLTDKKELAIPGKMATVKKLSNPLMAGSLPKTTLPTQLVINVVFAVQLLLNAASWFNSFNFHP